MLDRIGSDSYMGAQTVMAGELEIGRMRVAVWPEYDDPGILVIYDGRFSDSTAFPARSRFYLPKEAVISDACSLSPDGQHFCQLYQVTAEEGWDIVELWLPFPNFYLSFHLPAVDIIRDRRAITYTIRSNHPIKTMEIDFQQPLRSSKFVISPQGGVQSVQNGFNHVRYVLDDLTDNVEHVFGISYLKQDKKPSVDIKYSSMTDDPRVWGSPYDVQKQAGFFVYVLFGSGIAVFLLLIGRLFWSWNRGQKKQ